MTRIQVYFLRHLQVFFYTLGQLRRAPLAAGMTIGVIGITLALPAGLFLLVENLQRVSEGWDKGGQISLFLKTDVNEVEAQKLADRIRRLPAVAKVEYISRAAALAEFQRLAGFGDTLKTLNRNPLPAVLVVHPAGARNAATLQGLVNDLRARDEVELAQLDLEWVRRLHALLAIGERAVALLAILLGLAVLVTLGNTIRLSVLNRRDEIEVTKLIGGTDAFIRRPFLYAGVLQGGLGALTTWLILGIGLWLTADPVRELAGLYGSDFRLHGLGFGTTTLLLATGAGLGWLGSRLAVGRHLRAIEPS